MRSSTHARFNKFRDAASDFSAVRAGDKAELVGDGWPRPWDAELGDAAKTLLAGIEASAVEKKQCARADMLRRMRNTLSDPVALRWLDAVAVLDVDENGPPAYFQLLGDGALEGVNSFAGNFYKFLSEHLPVSDTDQFWKGEQGRLSLVRLQAALFGKLALEQQDKDAAGGFYFPGAHGSP